MGIQWTLLVGKTTKQKKIIKTFGDTQRYSRNTTVTKHEIFIFFFSVISIFTYLRFAQDLLFIQDLFVLFIWWSNSRFVLNLILDFHFHFFFNSFAKVWEDKENAANNNNNNNNNWAKLNISFDFFFSLWIQSATNHTKLKTQNKNMSTLVYCFVFSTKNMSSCINLKKKIRISKKKKSASCISIYILKQNCEADHLVSLIIFWLCFQRYR